MKFIVFAFCVALCFSSCTSNGSINWDTSTSVSK